MKIDCLATMELTPENLEDTIVQNEIVIIFFWKDECAGSELMGPVYSKVSEDHEDVLFALINIIEQRELSLEFGIDKTPTVVVYRKGIPVFKRYGMMPEVLIEELLGVIRELDMDEVSKQLTEARSRLGSKRNELKGE